LLDSLLLSDLNTLQVKVWLGDGHVGGKHYYIMSRYLICRMLTVTKIPQMKVGHGNWIQLLLFQDSPFIGSPLCEPSKHAWDSWKNEAMNIVGGSVGGVGLSWSLGGFQRAQSCDAMTRILQHI